MEDLRNYKNKTRPEGLEPPTSGFGDLRSTNWTKGALIFVIYNNTMITLFSQLIYFKEREGFEPSLKSPLNSISSAAP